MTIQQLKPEEFGYTKLTERGADKPLGTIAIKRTNWDWDYYAPPKPAQSLPTAPWTIIRVIDAERAGFAGKVLTRNMYAEWYNAGIQISHGDLQRDIRKFEILAKPVVEDDGF